MCELTSICLTGGDGSGKSTQITRLHEHFTRRGVAVGVVSVWHAFTDPAVTAQMPIKGPSDIYGYLRLLGPDSRLHFLFHALHLALQRAREQRPQLLLLDGYWFKYFAAEVAHGADPVVLRNLAVSFPIPDMTFHLVLGTDEALSRKTNRSDYENGFSDGAQDFLAFQGRMRVVLQGLARDLGWIEVDARRRPADITTSMIEQIEVCHGFTG